MSFPLDDNLTDNQAVVKRISSSAAMFSLQSWKNTSQDTDDDFLCDEFESDHVEVIEDHDQNEFDKDDNVENEFRFISVTSVSDYDRLKREASVRGRIPLTTANGKACHDILIEENLMEFSRCTSDADPRGAMPSAMSITVSKAVHRKRVHFPPEGCEVSHVFEYPWCITNDDCNLLYYTGHELQR